MSSERFNQYYTLSLTLEGSGQVSLYDSKTGKLEGIGISNQTVKFNILKDTFLVFLINEVDELFYASKGISEPQKVSYKKYRTTLSLSTNNEITFRFKEPTYIITTIKVNNPCNEFKEHPFPYYTINVSSFKDGERSTILDYKKLDTIVPLPTPTSSIAVTPSITPTITPTNTPEPTYNPLLPRPSKTPTPTITVTTTPTGTVTPTVTTSNSKYGRSYTFSKIGGDFCETLPLELTEGDIITCTYFPLTTKSRHFSISPLWENVLTNDNSITLTVTRELINLYVNSQLTLYLNPIQSRKTRFTFNNYNGPYNFELLLASCGRDEDYYKTIEGFYSNFTETIESTPPGINTGWVGIDNLSYQSFKTAFVENKVITDNETVEFTLATNIIGSCVVSYYMELENGKDDDVCTFTFYVDDVQVSQLIGGSGHDHTLFDNKIVISDNEETSHVFKWAFYIAPDHTGDFVQSRAVLHDVYFNRLNSFFYTPQSSYHQSVLLDNLGTPIITDFIVETPRTLLDRFFLVPHDYYTKDKLASICQCKYLEDNKLILHPSSFATIVDGLWTNVNTFDYDTNVAPGTFLNNVNTILNDFSSDGIVVPYIEDNVNYPNDYIREVVIDVIDNSMVVTRTPTPTVTPTLTPTISISPTPSQTTSNTPTLTPTPTITLTPSITVSTTLTPTPTPTPSITGTNTPTPTPTNTCTITPSSNTPTPTPTLSLTPYQFTVNVSGGSVQKENSVERTYIVPYTGLLIPGRFTPYDSTGITYTYESKNDIVGNVDTQIFATTEQPITVTGLVEQIELVSSRTFSIREPAPLITVYPGIYAGNMPSSSYNYTSMILMSYLSTSFESIVNKDDYARSFQMFPVGTDFNGTSLVFYCGSIVDVTPTPSPGTSPTPSITMSGVTPTPTPTISLSASQTVTPTVTPTDTVTSTPSVTPTLTPTIPVSATVSLTPSITQSNTATVTPTASVSLTPTITVSSTITPTPTPTPTITPTITASVTNTPIPSITPTRTPTKTPTPTLTPSHSKTIKTNDITLNNLTPITQLNAVATERDAIAQSFLIDSTTYPEGLFVSSIEVFFKSKDPIIPVWLELRPSVNSYPSSKERVPLSFVYKKSSDVVISTDASLSTKFTFDSPIYLLPSEFNIVISSDSSLYEVWLGTVGQFKLGSTTDRILNNPYVGVFFKSSNGSTWLSVMESDLKFKLNRCVFDTTATGLTVLNNESYYSNAISNSPYTYTTTKLNLLTLIPEKTSIASLLRAIKVDSISDTVNMLIESNQTTELPNQYKIIDSDFDGEDITSFKASVTLSTTKDTVSPVIDLERISAVLVDNQINKLITDVELESEIQKTGGDAKCRYISSVMKLSSETPANKILVTFAACLQSGTNVRVYYKILNSLYEKITTIAQKPWTYIGNATQLAKNKQTFIDFSFETTEPIVYSGNSLITDFDRVAIKLVLESDNPSIIPKIKDLRIIALTI